MQLQQTREFHAPAKIGTKPRIYDAKKARGPMLDRVYSLRYNSYSSEGYIGEDLSGKFIDPYDKMPNCTSYLVYNDKKVIASIRVCVYEPSNCLSVPSQEVFSEEINQQIGLGVKFAEINKFVVDPAFQQKGGVRARFELFKAIAEESLYGDIENVVMAVRSNHVRFYNRMFDCVPISEEKSYPGITFKTVLLLMKNIQGARDLVFSKFDKQRE